MALQRVASATALHRLCKFTTDGGLRSITIWFREVLCGAEPELSTQTIRFARRSAS